MVFENSRGWVLGIPRRRGGKLAGYGRNYARAPETTSRRGSCPFPLAFERLGPRRGVQLRPYRCQDCAAAAVPEEPWTPVTLSRRARTYVADQGKRLNVAAGGESALSFSLSSSRRASSRSGERVKMLSGFDRVNGVACRYLMTLLLCGKVGSIGCFVMVSRRGRGRSSGSAIQAVPFN